MLEITKKILTRISELRKILMLLAIFYFVISALTAKCTPQTQTCEAEKCETIGETEICTQCQAGNVPIDGKCVEANTVSEKCKNASGDADANQVCGKCIGANFFMYKGGCYDKTGTPGSTICKTAGEGVCDDCQEGYFKNPEAAATTDSCISCGDMIGVTIIKDTNAKTYKGVDGCAKCTPPNRITENAGIKTATCTGCDSNKIVKTDTSGTSCIEESACSNGFFVSDQRKAQSKDKKCIACNVETYGVASCNECIPRIDDPAKANCTACSDNKKPNLEGTECNSCTDQHCAFCVAEGTCQKCSSGFILDGQNCVKSDCKTENCKACTNPKAANEVCTECVSTHHLTPTSQCVQYCQTLGNYYAGTNADNKKACKECAVANCKTCGDQGQCQTCNNGFYKNGDACSPCHESCKTCSAGTASDCTECPTGKALRYGEGGTKGTCGEGCTTGQGSGACKTCGLTIDGASYCSECATTTEYPQNGICTSTTARTAATCKNSNVANGICSLCTNGFLRMNGGCYETTKFPRKSVCTTTPDADTCTSVTSGYYIDGSSNLVVCSDGCAECTTSSACTTCKDGYTKIGSSQTCTKCDSSCETCTGAAITYKACATGYYKTALGESTCTSCETGSNGVTGIKGCLNCVPPSSNTGSVLCYLMKDADSTGGNTNKSGLSTGAIAEISVAVIVVVAGLVGFLCWWFICRGKA